NDENSVDISFHDGTQHRFDHIALTVPSPLVADLCPQLTSAEQERAQSIEYQGIICASVLLKEPLAQFYVTNITDTWVPFTAVIEMSTLVDRKHFNGNSLVYLPKYVAWNDPAFDKSDEELRSTFIAALAKMYPHFRSEDVLSFQVSRVRHVFALSTLGYSENVPKGNTSQPGIHIVNSAQILNGTLNVNETIQIVDKALLELLSADVRSTSLESATV